MPYQKSFEFNSIWVSVRSRTPKNDQSTDSDRRLPQSFYANYDKTLRPIISNLKAKL